MNKDMILNIGNQRKEKLPKKIEALKINGWENAADGIPKEITVENDSLVFRFLRDDMDRMGLLNFYHSNGFSILFIEENLCPGILRSRTARQAVDMAARICLREGWPLTAENIIAALNNLEMDW